MRQFSDIPHEELTLMDVYEECDRRISNLDPAQFENDEQYDAAVKQIIDTLMSELKDVWK